MVEMTDAHALALERSCSLTAVALSGQRREGVRLVTGVNREFGLSSTLDFVYVPYPQPERDWNAYDRDLRCGGAMFTVQRTSRWSIESTSCPYGS